MMLATKELIERLLENPCRTYEVVIQKGVARCTHFIYAEDGTLYDTGIDDEETTWTPEETRNFTPTAPGSLTR